MHVHMLTGGGGDGEREREWREVKKFTFTYDISRGQFKTCW